jgi:hypothetical protein
MSCTGELEAPTKEEWKNKEELSYVTQWKQCSGETPHKPASSSNSAQVQFAKNIFNKHSLHTIYYCKFQRQKNCNARLKYIVGENKWHYKGTHSYPDNSILMKQKTSKPLLSDLTDIGLDQLKSYVLAHKRNRNTKDICSVLNAGYESDNSSAFIYPEQVIQAKEKFVYTYQVEDLSEIYIRSDLRDTCKGNPFLRFFLSYPVFMIVYAADWQIDILKSATSEDLLFIDGTFRVCRQNVSQMVSLLMKKIEWQCVVPLVFVLLQDQNTEAYVEMWNYIHRLAPSLRKVENLLITVDYEMTMHNTIQKTLPRGFIVGCELLIK